MVLRSHPWATLPLLFLFVSLRFLLSLCLVDCSLVQNRSDLKGNANEEFTQGHHGEAVAGPAHIGHRPV